jgi:carboxyl-terminal processing protease
MKNFIMKIPERLRRKSGITLPFILLLLSVSWLFTAGTRQNDFEISKNLDIFATLFRQLNMNYADEINPGRLTKTAIDAMLGSLDPFTVYMPEADIEDYRINQAGQAGSAGFQVIARDGRVMIVSMNNNGSAAGEGLWVGDEIIAVDGKSVDGHSAEEINQILTGQAGTKLIIKARRPFTGAIMEVSLERSHIREQTIPWSGMLDQDIAYISLKTFSQNASGEIKEAFLKLTSQNKVKGLVLDLRGNGGGLLMEAVAISNLFVKQNELIVSTRGRIPDRNKIYRTFSSPIDMNLPLVVLMDEMSASASEIVAGSLQDLDRAVIIGQRSYGKGLVQNVVPLVYNAQLKVTIAKYYIPSGRCIQAIDYFDPTGSHQVPDSLIKPFKTRNGRTVFDGKGIIPDIQVEKSPQNPLVKSLVSKYVIFDFATWFKTAHASIEAPEKFEVTETIWEEFVDFVAKQKFVYQPESEKVFSDLLVKLDKEGYAKILEPESTALKSALAEAKKNDLTRSRSEIARLIKKELIYRYYYDTGLVKMGLSGDREIKESYRVLDDKSVYSSLTSGGYRPL